MNDEATNIRAKLSDAGYVARLQSGDEVALDELCDWMYRKLPGHIASKYHLSVQDAEDLATDLVQRVRRGLRGFTPHGERSLSNWIFTIVRNRALTEINRRRIEASPERELARQFYEYELTVWEYISSKTPEQEAAILREFESDDQAEKELSPEEKIALEALYLLSARYQRILLLRHIDEYKSIAEHELAEKYQGDLIPEKALKAKINQLRVLHKRAMDSWLTLIKDLQEGKQVKRKKSS